MEHEEILDEYTAKIEEHLTPYFENLFFEGKRYHPFIGEVYDSLSEFVLRKGKRLATTSTLIIYKGYKGELDENIMRVGLGVELSRHSILMHDDLVDRDEKRRGGKTFHKSFDKDERYGDSIALFAGNMLFSLAMNSILNSGFTPNKIRDVADLFVGDYQAVNESQILDLDFEYRMVDEEEWYTMAKKRAATLFHTTILTGAILGDAPTWDIELLEEASSNIGYSFDIQDDIIGAFASSEQYGRPPGDFDYWKKPLHMVYALKLAKGGEVEEIEKAIGKREEVERIREIISTSGALDKAKDKSGEHAAKAIELLDQTDLDGATKDFFASLIDYVAGSLDWYR